MSDEWKNKRKIHPFWSFGELQKYINEIIQDALGPQNKAPTLVYVLLISDDPDLRAIANRRGNLNEQQINNRVTEEQKTLIDVFDEKNQVVVVAEVPNIKKEDIELEKTGDFLTIWVNKPQRRNLKTIELPDRTNVKEAKIKCGNRVLEVTLPKTEKARKKD